MYAEFDEIDDATAEAAATTAETLVSDALAGAGDGGGDAEGGEEEEGDESVRMDDNLSYLTPLLRFLTMTHLLVSFSILLAYYQLKVSV